MIVPCLSLFLSISLLVYLSVCECVYDDDCILFLSEKAMRSFPDVIKKKVCCWETNVCKTYRTATAAGFYYMFFSLWAIQQREYNASLYASFLPLAFYLSFASLWVLFERPRKKDSIMSLSPMHFSQSRILKKLIQHFDEDRKKYERQE